MPFFNFSHYQKRRIGFLQFLGKCVLKHGRHAMNSTFHAHVIFLLTRTKRRKIVNMNIVKCVAVHYKKKIKDGLYMLQFKEPAFFRELFGDKWDMFYAFLVMISTYLINLDVSNSNSILILTTCTFTVILSDVIIALDSIVDVSIRIFHVHRDVSRGDLKSYIKNTIGILTDLISCVPFVLFLYGVIGVDHNQEILYSLMSVLRLARIFSPGCRMALGRNIIEKIYFFRRQNEPKYDAQCRSNENLAFGDFEREYRKFDEEYAKYK